MTQVLKLNTWQLPGSGYPEDVYPRDGDPELGYMGEAAILDGEYKIRGENSLAESGMNIVLSDRIKLNRALPDYRDKM